MKEIKIGNFSIIPVLLAPMAGVTDVPFRRVVMKYGAGLTVSEMVAGRAMVLKTKDSLKKIERSEFEDVSMIQLVGHEPDVMAEAARMNVDAGADIIDLNMGCPVRKVVGGNDGAALMRDESLAVKIIEAVVGAVKVPVTVKMRLGWDDGSKNAPKLAKLAEDAGVSMITVHGRTRAQMYSGKADWSAIAKVKECVNVPVIANGDIISPESARECLEVSGADGVMIGRGACGKPWLLNQVMCYLCGGEVVPDPSMEEKARVIIEHYNDMIDYYGERVGVPFARKHIGWYTAGMPGSAAFRAEFNRILMCNEAMRKLREYLFSLSQRM